MRGRAVPELGLGTDTVVSAAVGRPAFAALEHAGG